jgi:pimeloyl-ACP methyl ester carboxylesterase
MGPFAQSDRKAAMNFRERGVSPTTLDSNEKTFRVSFEAAGGLSLFLRFLPSTVKASRRRAVLYAHGARLASAVTVAHRFDGFSWRDDLASDGWDVWALDYIGYGGADRYAAMMEAPEANPPLCRADEASRQIECAAEFIAAHSKISNLSIVAHSWGTNAAALMAIRRPELVDRLVMFAPVTHRPGAAGQAPFVPAWQYITVDDWCKTIAADVPAGERPIFDKDHFRIWGQAYLACDAESGDRSPPSVKTPWGALTDVSELWSGGTLFDPADIKVPTLIVRGEWDSYSTDADAKWLFDGLKRAPVKRDVKIARGTHFLLFEDNRFDLYEETRAFLAGERARRGDPRVPDPRATPLLVAESETSSR